MPGVWEVGAVAAAAAFPAEEAWGGGGGGGKGDFEPGVVLGDGTGSGVATVEACRRSLSIFSLYALFRDSIDSWPSLGEN